MLSIVTVPTSTLNRRVVVSSLTLGSKCNSDGQKNSRPQWKIEPWSLAFCVNIILLDCPL